MNSQFAFLGNLKLGNPTNKPPTKSKSKSKTKSKSKSSTKGSKSKSTATRSVRRAPRNNTITNGNNTGGNGLNEEQNAMMDVINKSEATNFNAMIRECVKNKEIKQVHRQVKPPVFATKEEYDNSFESVISFRKRFTDGELKEIDTIVFNENNDGFFAAATAYHAIAELGGKITKIVKSKPLPMWDPARALDRGCKALFVDIDWSEFTLRKILEHCSFAIVLDDHLPKMKHNNFYSSWIESKGKNEHCASAVTWKFFYPKVAVPTVISYIDSSDAKLFLPWVSYTHMFTEAMGFRYTHSRDPRMYARIQSGEIFEKLWEIIQQSNINDLITFGNYYFQVTEALKDQIAANAVIATFQGYRVGVLNFRSPALTKKVGRQICTNLAGKIDFAVLWAWEYNANAYGITLIDDHKTGKVDLRELGDRLKVIGGHPKGGGGRRNEYNLYWPKNDRHDIWELFQ